MNDPTNTAFGFTAGDSVLVKGKEVRARFPAKVVDIGDIHAVIHFYHDPKDREWILANKYLHSQAVIHVQLEEGEILFRRMPHDAEYLRKA